MYNRTTRTAAICLISISILSGCETLSLPRYVEPDSSDLPVIINNANQSPYSKWAWERYTLVAIDDTVVDYSITHRDPEKNPNYGKGTKKRYAID